MMNTNYETMRGSNRLLEDGYVEYIIFHSEGASSSPSPEVFQKAYNVIAELHHNPAIQERTPLLRARLKEIDRTLEITPIPRTLFDLIFIRAGIEEDIIRKSCCPLQYSNNNFRQDHESKIQRYQDELADFRERLDEETNPSARARGEAAIARKNQAIEDEQNSYQETIERCWHSVHFDDKHPIDLHSPQLHSLAGRVNDLMIKRLKPQGFFSERQIAQFVEREVAFFRSHYNYFKTCCYVECGQNCAVHNFSSLAPNGSRLSIEPMGVQSDQEAQIIYNAVALECSLAAKNAFLLYRGSSNAVEEKRPSPDYLSRYSISYGTGLLAGALRDATATPFHYAAGKKRPTYALIIPYNQLDREVLHLPPAHAVAQMSARGELFHARIKIPQEKQGATSFLGLDSFALRELPPFLKSAYTAEEMAQRLAPLHESQVTLFEG